ncbi:hypothetical protein HGRIS_004665 [Hohenbuehelia grisea]|uniref:Serine dehydratase-like alpha subunit domain-containing protein n=1 Tax=Hohenbuehelia grisea TaxID=104357 RepID=A0ABR3JCM7_9AGAR
MNHSGGPYLLWLAFHPVDENLFYKGVDKRAVHGARLHQTHSLAEPHLQQPTPEAISDATANALETGIANNNAGSFSYDEHPPYPFESGDSLLALTQKHNMTIAQIVYDNEKYFGYTDEDIHTKLMKIWGVMDDCIRTGVSTSETTLPGRLGLRRRAPMLYRRLMRGFYPGVAHPTLPSINAPSTSGVNAIDGPLETNADPDSDLYEGGALPGMRGAEDGLGMGTGLGSERVAAVRRRAAKAGKSPTRVVGSFNHEVLPMPPRKTVIPAMDFLSCYAIAVNEVNAGGGRIVTSPTNGAAGVIPAVLKYIIEFVSDDTEKSITTFLLTASAVGMLFKRGSTISAAEGGCQAEVGVACSMASAGFAACMGAVKAVTAAQLSMASHGVYSVTLDEAIEAMRLTAADMSVKYKETSMSGLATSVKIPLTVPAC